MSSHDWQKLEALMYNNDEALKDIAIKYPDLVMRWVALTKRNGKYCPLSRGLIKQLVYFEKDNKQFKNNIDTQTWHKVFV